MTATAFRLHAAERELVASEAERFAASVASAEAQDAYGRLARAAEDGELSDDLVGALGRILELGLRTGRIREVYGKHAEMSARSVYRRTPQGRELSSRAGDVNDALAALAGQALQRISVAAPSPGAHTLTIQTDEARIVLTLGPEGPDVKSVEVSL